MQKRTKRTLFFLLLVLLVFLGARFLPEIRQQANKTLYPIKYQESVEKYAALYDLDPLLLYSFIKTESSFNPEACSHVDARGLMQITEVTFDWIKPKVAAEESVVFDDLYDPDTCIRFGSYYISRSLARYEGDIATAAAAYHSGWGTVDKLLKDPAYSNDGKTLDVFPYNQMNHYVAKITHAYHKYQAIYRPEGET